MNKIIILITSTILTNVSYAESVSQFVTMDYEHRHYTSDRGNNNLSFLTYGLKSTQGSIVAKVGNSIKTSGKGRDTGTLGSIDLYYNWNDLLSTKTGFSISDRNSSFLHKEYHQDISVKPIKNLVVTVGGKYTEYAKDVNVNSVSTGFSYYLDKKAIISYKYSYFTSKDRGSSHGNTFSFKLKDNEGTGNTQLWLGVGTGAYSYEWDDDKYKKNTNFKSITLRREQPIADQWTLGIAIGRNWYSTPIDKYTALNAKVDLTYKW